MDPLTNITKKEITDKKDFINDYTLVIINTIVLAVLAAGVSLVGIVANVFNVLIFAKQGLSDTVNIGLMGLAVSDLCSLISLEMLCLLRNPLFYNSVDIDVDEVQHLVAAWPHNTFARISSWITAYIMLERCLCVVVPLKIKTIITPRVTISVIVFIFVFMILTVIPEYASCYIAWRVDPRLNTSLLGLVFREGRENVAAVSFNFSAGTQLGSFGAVIFFTSILVAKMKQKSKWRQSASSQGQDSSKKGNREQKTIKMIILVAVIYCICFLPMLCECITTCLLPEFIMFGVYSNCFVAFWSVSFLLDGINSSVNIFVYHRMSTKYRTTFDALVYRKT